MLLTDTGRLGSGPCYRCSTVLILTPIEDVACIKPVMNSGWKSFTIRIFFPLVRGPGSMHIMSTIIQQSGIEIVWCKECFILKYKQ